MQRLIAACRSAAAASTSGQGAEWAGVKTLLEQLQPEEIVPGRIPKDAVAWQTPVQYYHYFEDDSVSIGLFFIREGGVIPLHNHPEMTVYSRVVFGETETLALDWVDHRNPAEGRIAAESPHLPRLASVTTLERRVANAAVTIEPTHNNMHQIQAISTCAFLDIFTPPYNDSNRDCIYYKPVGVVPALEEGAELLLEAYEPHFTTSNYQRLPPAPPPPAAAAAAAASAALGTDGAESGDGWETCSDDDNGSNSNNSGGGDGIDDGGACSGGRDGGGSVVGPG